MLAGPCLFSTTTGWPSSSDRGWPMMRVTMSVPPPGPAPTITWIGRVGHSCAEALTATSPVAAASSSVASLPIMRSSWLGLLLVLDRVTQDPDALDLAGVAVLHPDPIGLARMADARRRAGEDDVARLEREPLRDVDQHLAHREHHVVGVVRLHHLAVYPAFDLEAFARVGQLVSGDHPGAEAAGAVEVLTHVPLRGLSLEFAHRALVRARPAGDAGGRVVHGEMLGALADDQHQLGLVVEGLRCLGAHDRTFVRHHRGE